MAKIEALIEKLTTAQVDYTKLFEKNNKSAATRLRATLEEVAKECKNLKKEALEYKKQIPKK